MSYAPETPVLVAVVTNQADWQRIHSEGWYRIPLQHAPQRLGARLLAWYQTRVFDAERWQVRWYAPITRIRLMLRRDLLPEERDHPRALEHYWRYDVGACAQLARPLRAAKLRRITFIPTTWERLNTANDVNDLWMGDSAVEVLCQELTAAGYSLTRRTLRESNRIGAKLPALYIQRLLDGIQIHWDGGAIRFSYVDLIWERKNCIQRLVYHTNHQHRIQTQAENTAERTA